MPPTEVRGLAFFDFDGTLVSGNVVHQYIWYARRQGSWWRLVRLATLVPFLKLADLYSREFFNLIFYREYRRFRQEWLQAESANLFREYVRAHLFEGAGPLIGQNRAEGFVNVLVTGSLDFAMTPVVAEFGFAELLANRLEFSRGGRATGRLLPPVLAGEEKVRAMLELCRRYNVEPSMCRAYSDDKSDLPMLEAVGHPTATNPKPSLRRIAAARGWPILDLGRRA